eukprot:scaffold25190_cov137-Cylindrotheca_fusiformis.AAC.1
MSSSSGIPLILDDIDSTKCHDPQSSLIDASSSGMRDTFGSLLDSVLGQPLFDPNATIKLLIDPGQSANERYT